MGKASKLVATSLELDLVARIDQLAHRDHITRATWMREAIIDAWKKSKEFKRTPLHGYLTTPIDIQNIQATELEQTKLRRKKS